MRTKPLKVRGPVDVHRSMDHRVSKYDGTNGPAGYYCHDCGRSISTIPEGLELAAVDLLNAARESIAGYGLLHDIVSDLVESGKIRKADLPDDYDALVQALEASGGADMLLGAAIAKTGLT